MLITTRWLNEAKATIVIITIKAFSGEQNGPTPRSRFKFSEKENGRTIRPVNRSVPARQARSMVPLFRSRCLVATAKMTGAFRRIVARAAIISMQIRATRCLYVSSCKYSARQASPYKLHFSFSGSKVLERLSSRKISDFQHGWVVPVRSTHQ